jgi:hypothetical protein
MLVEVANMAKKCAMLFAAVGYVLVIWNYSVAFAPVTWEPARHLLWYGCVACINVTGSHSGVLRGAFLFVGPLNALIYAGVGFLLGKLHGINATPPNAIPSNASSD